MNVERWQSLLEGMIEAVWLVDPLTLRIVAANRAATSMLDMDPGKLVGKAVTELATTCLLYTSGALIAARQGLRAG